ncbi:hypothetical protein [Algoriphagus limi]|uniref:Uncharacterized protein n=1 Tax=Algoriphagus limi TaxID=2975273 RepID=A0ABT2G0U7_9BACT|nr:hypothetical protein [Algoriphagus limi]MCS5488893.1 hypothetical protein [Algoriphagus limi]
MKKEKKKNIHISDGCLPLFILVFILFVIRVTIARGKIWESNIVDLLLFFYWSGIVYMVLVFLVNKANEPKKRTRIEILTTSIEEHKKQIEKFIDIGGKFKDTYQVDNSQFLSYHLVEYFNEKRELDFLKSKGWFSKSEVYKKKSDHDLRMKLIAEIIKKKGLSGYVFWGGLYEGQAYELYFGINECETPGCYNQVGENWHKLCPNCFFESKQHQ